MKLFNQIKEKLSNLFKDKKRLLKLVIILLIIVISVFAFFKECSKKNSLESSTTHYTIEKNEKKEVLLAVQPISTLNPIISKSETVRQISNLVYSSLVTFDENMTPKYDVIEKITFDGDKAHITLKDIKFTDGKALTAEDVEFTVQAIKTYGENSPYYAKADKIKSVSGTGTSLTITFKDDNDMLLSYLAFPILPNHQYNGVSDLIRQNDMNFEVVGSGIYKVSKVEASEGVSLITNSDYYGDKATNSIKINFVNDNIAKYRSVESSNVTVLYTTDESPSINIQKKDIKIKYITNNQAEFIGFNCNENNAMSNKNMRKAMSYAINKNDMLAEDYKETLVSSDTLYYPKYLGVKDINLTSYKYSLTKASELLKKEGYEDDNEDGYREDKSGKILTLRILVNSDKNYRVDVAEKLQEAIKNLNIKTEIVSVNTSTYMQKLQSNDFDIYVGGMQFDDSLDIASLVRSDGTNNYGKYENEKLDKKIDKLKSGLKVSSMRTEVEEIMKILNDDMPYYSLGYTKAALIKSNVFKGELSPTFINPYIGIQKWYCEYEKQVENEN